MNFDAKEWQIRMGRGDKEGNRRPRGGCKAPGGVEMRIKRSLFINNR